MMPSSPCFSLYREALKILLAGPCEDTHSLLLAISGKPNDHCGCAYAKMPIRCFSPHGEALKILVSGLCEDIHPLYLSISGNPKDPCGWPMAKIPIPLFLSISGSRKDPCGWPMRRYPSPCFSLYREALKILVVGLYEDTHPLLLSI